MKCSKPILLSSKSYLLKKLIHNVVLATAQVDGGQSSHVDGGLGPIFLVSISRFE
jgi:hypothetical protein